MAVLGLKPLPVDPTKPLEFPESDGKPMGETGIHVNQSLDLLAALKLHFRDRADVYVGANMFVYFEPTDPKLNVCPDVFVAFDVKPGERRTWKTWEEGKPPDVIIEITSKTTRLEDTRGKRMLYEELDVQEYFLFDPLNEYLKPRLQGYRLEGGSFQHLISYPLMSEVLNVELRIKEDDRLHLFDLQRGEWLLTPVELFEKAAVEHARADEERARAREERARAEAAEAQVARLKEELARLKGE